MKNILTILIITFFIHNSNAQTSWIYTYNHGVDYTVNSVDTTSDHGYFIAGGHYTRAYYGNYFAAKLDSNGNEIWHIDGTRYDGMTYGNFANCIVNSGDGGCLVGGTIDNYIYNTLYFIRLDASGNVLWEKILSGNQHQYIGSLIKLGNKYFCTYVISQAVPIFAFLLELNDQGDSLSSFGLNMGISSFSSSIIHGLNNDLIVLGGVHDSVNSNLTHLSYCEIDTLGNILYTRILPDTINSYPETISQTSDNGFIFSSFNYQYGLSYITKVDSTGLITWQNSYSSTHWCAAAIQEDTNIIVSTGTSLNNVSVLRINSYGNSSGSASIPIGQISSEVYDNIIDWNGDLVICGTAYNSITCNQCLGVGFVAKLISGNINEVEENNSFKSTGVNISPNPLNPSLSDLKIHLNNLIDEIKMYDFKGNIVSERKINEDNSNPEFHIPIKKDLTPGLYMLLFEYKSKIVSYKKLIVIN